VLRPTGYALCKRIVRAARMPRNGRYNMEIIISREKKRRRIPGPPWSSGDNNASRGWNSSEQSIGVTTTARRSHHQRESKKEGSPDLTCSSPPCLSARVPAHHKTLGPNRRLHLTSTHASHGGSRCRVPRCRPSNGKTCAHRKPGSAQPPSPRRWRTRCWPPGWLAGWRI
jgi:hypothetical protein